MLNFENDYNRGAHPEVLKYLEAINGQSYPGYGMDPLSEAARDKIRKACGTPDAAVELVVGGTMANSVVISTALRDFEGVIAADTGHVSVHEAGAIELLGHKVLTLPNKEGKVTAPELRSYIDAFYADETHPHMVYPGMVYISHPTEYGTLYSRQELSDIAAVCRGYGIPLYMDGARLAYALMSPGNDLTLKDIAALTDIFYIGGTKCGALFGEAIVYTGFYPEHFMTSQKRRGALLAKGWLLGAQFDALFTDGLYERIGQHAIAKAKELKEVIDKAGIEYLINSPTNQQYIILSDERAAKLSQKVRLSIWERLDGGRTAVRLVTSFATTDEDIEGLRKIL